MAGESDDVRTAWVERVLGISLPPPASTRAPDPGVAFAQARLRYDAGRKQVSADVGRLMSAMRTAFAREPDFAAISAAIETFAGLRDLLDERLMDELDRGYSATDDAGRVAARRSALSVLASYRGFLADNGALLDGLDVNPFVPVSVERVLSPLLDDLAEQLQRA